MRSFGIARVAAGIRHLVAELRVAGIPGDLQRLVRNRRRAAAPASAPGRGVARVLVFEHERQAALRRLGRRRAHDVVDRGAVRLLIVEPPEIEDADPIGVEGARELERALEQLVLLRRSVKLAPNSSRVGLNGDFGAPGQSTLKIGDARQATRRLKRSSDALHVGDLRGVPVHEVLAAGLAQIDEAHAELARRDLAGVAEVLRDFVGQHREIEARPIAGAHAARRAARCSRAAANRAPGLSTEYRHREIASDATGHVQSQNSSRIAGAQISNWRSSTWQAPARCGPRGSLLNSTARAYNWSSQS